MKNKKQEIGGWEKIEKEFEENGLFYDLVAAFEKITGIPVILNTSFNVQGMPIVNSPDDALDCFFSTEMDYLVMGDYLVTKDKSGSHPDPVI